MTDNLRTIIVDGDEIEVPNHYTLLQAAEAAGKEIPRFCYHERLSVAGNCRMCLVELVGAPKPAASCAMNVSDMRGGPNGEPPAMNTASPMVKKAREGVMEFLLINHPLDCPICDQGGECDLQDQAMAYGRSGTRYTENKRAVEDKNMGPLVKTIMTRCIQCTRCVRFVTEVAGSPEIGMLNRGEDAEITTYLESNIQSELSGNVIDLCPVGALTSKPYAYNARPWELKKTETIDVMDAMGSWIRVDSRGPGVLRIMPRVNDEINEEWISDKTRFVWDGLQAQRLDKPYAKLEDYKLHLVDWEDALDRAAARMTGEPGRIAAVVGDMSAAEDIKAAKDFFDSFGVTNLIGCQDGADFGEGPRESWLFNSTFAGIDEADAILLIGSDPRLEAPVLNARIRRAWLERDVKVGAIGEVGDLTYPVEQVGSGPQDLKALAGKRSGFIKVLKDAKKPMIIVGAGALAREDGKQILRTVGELAARIGAVKPGWNGFNVLHTAASRVAALDLGFVPGEGGRDLKALQEYARDGQLETVFLMGADELSMDWGAAFVVYIGHHGDAGAHRANLILPAPAYTEKKGIWTNMEGRVQMNTRAIFPKGEAKEDWAIFRALSERAGKTLPYNSIEELRLKLIEDHPVFGGLDHAPAHASAADFDVASIGEAGDMAREPFRSAITDFYLTNAIARASKTLAECSALRTAPQARAAE